MKKIALIALVAVSLTANAAQKTPDLEFTDGRELTLINKLMDTPRRYARVDTAKYDGFTDYQRKSLVQYPAGLALAFETNSDCVYCTIGYQKKNSAYNQPDLAASGVDLYIRDKDGQWKYAGNNTPRKKPGERLALVSNLAPGNKECILYLPLISIVDSVSVGVAQGCYVRPIDNPFRHRVVFWGSSFTHGVSSSRPGMPYPMQFERATGLHTPVLGVSGNSKLQQSFARVLADTPADAFVFDAFSNPTAEEIEANFGPFMATLRAKHPVTPVVFMQTIYREHRNFDTQYDARERAKQETARRVVSEAMDNDPNLYFIEPNAGDNHETSCDGTHPSDFGYYIWMQSIRQPLLDILARYGIR